VQHDTKGIRAQRVALAVLCAAAFAVCLVVDLGTLWTLTNVGAANLDAGGVVAVVAVGLVANAALIASLVSLSERKLKRAWPLATLALAFSIGWIPLTLTVWA
jgi:hypothetical protein